LAHRQLLVTRDEEILVLCDGFLQVVEFFLLFVFVLHAALPLRFPTVSSYAAFALNGVTSSGTPGPMVEHSVALLTYFPLAAAGFALITACIRLLAFSSNLLFAKLTFPTGAWTTPVLSTRNSTLPALISWIAFRTSVVTVPVLGFGIKPRGPSTLPRRPTERI